MLRCERSVGVSGNIPMGFSGVFCDGDWGISKWTRGVWKFLFRRGCIICLFISTVFWFWLGFLILLNSCGSVGYKLYVGSLRGACRWTGSSGSDKRACRSSKVYGLSWKEIRVDVWGLLVVEGVVGLSWDDVGEDWLGDFWVAIFDSFLVWVSEKVNVY